MALTREQILTAPDIKTETVKVPEWGGEICVRSMTAADRDEYEQSLIASRGPDENANMRNVRARLLVTSVVDGTGKRLFTEADVEALGAKGAKAVNRVYKVAARLNALTEADVEELAKNSGADPSGDSPST